MAPKILVSVNTLSEVDSQAYPSHLVHAYRMGRDTDCEFILHTPRRMPIASARNSAAEIALKEGCDYVFFYDDDMELHPNTFKTLLSRDKDIIMALCYIRGYPFRPMVFKWVEKDDLVSRTGDIKMEGKGLILWDDCEKHANSDGLIEPVAAVGCAATLVRTEVFRNLDYPWFYTGMNNTEDVYFCMKVHDNLEGVSIAVDTTVPAGHILKDRDILYPFNSKFLREKVEKYGDYCKGKAEESARSADESDAE